MRTQTRRLIVLAAVAVLATAATVQAYTYNSLGQAGGWEKAEKTSSPTYVLDRSDYTVDGGLSEADVTGALTRGFDTWASVPGSSLGFTELADLGGNYDLLDGPADSAGPPWFGGYAGDMLDGNSDYLYANITVGGWLPNSYFDYLEDGQIDGQQSGILGVTWIGQVREGGKGKPRWVVNLFFNDGWTWTLDGDDPLTAEFEIDIETVALHELGHAIGLGHEDDVPSVMNTYYGGTERALYEDDANGVLSLYEQKGGGGDDDGGGGKPPWAGGPGGKNGTLTTLNIDDYRDLGAVTVPEPATLLILTSGIALLRRRRRNA